MLVVRGSRNNANGIGDSLLYHLLAMSDASKLDPCQPSSRYGQEMKRVVEEAASLCHLKGGHPKMGFRSQMRTQDKSIVTALSKAMPQKF